MPSILYENNNAVAIIRLNRPEKLNAFNREMSLLLQSYLQKATADKSVRAIYLCGSGNAFSAGQDLMEVADPSGPGLEKVLSEQFNPIVLQIRNVEKPVIAAVYGVAAGAGANIALCCDVVVASKASVFIQAFSKIGLIPDSGGTYFLPRLIGWQKASAVMMLGDKIGADEAERMGMIYRVFENENFDADSFAIAVQLSAMPTRGLALTKQALNRSATNTLQQQLDCEDELQKLAGAGKDYAEGVKAFIQKRKPLFTGE